MKQVLLRMPDDVHLRLRARAEREGRSLNAVATDILDAAADADRGDRQARLRAQAAASGMLRGTGAPAVSDARRQRIIETTRGAGPFIDEYLADERNR